MRPKTAKARRFEETLRDVFAKAEGVARAEDLLAARAPLGEAPPTGTVREIGVRAEGPLTGRPERFSRPARERGGEAMDGRLQAAGRRARGHRTNRNFIVIDCPTEDTLTRPPTSPRASPFGAGAG